MIKIPGEEACYQTLPQWRTIPDNTERHGVSITLSEAAQVTPLASLPVSPRLTSARLKGVFVNLTVEAAYDLTLDTAQKAKDSFYDL